MIALYIHVPFCSKKCPYCDFYSLKGNNDLFLKYTDSLCAELVKMSNMYQRRAKTLYIGGGTPNLIGTYNLSKIIQVAVKNFNIPEFAEISMEVNPLKASELDFLALRKQGLNRLSIGLQSANYGELKLLGREHSLEDVKNTVRLAQDAGINNISLDLMLGISNQNEQSILRSIDFCDNLSVQHISVYILKIENNTMYSKIKDQLRLPSGDRVADLYLLACEELEKRGFLQYEISNFAKKNKESRHNLAYWDSEEYLGIGPSAHSFINGKRFYYPRNLNKFLSGMLNFVEEEESSIKNASEEEFIMLKLRQNKGLLSKEFRQHFSKNIKKEVFTKAKILQSYGYVETDGISFVKLTRAGFLLSNSIIKEFL